MDAIKKKMQAMKLEKDNAMDRADTCEQQARDANLRAEKVPLSLYPIPRLETKLIILNILSCAANWPQLTNESSPQSEEEVRALQKKMQQLENDLDQAQEQLLAANAKLEEKDKALQNVSPSPLLLSFKYAKWREI